MPKDWVEWHRGYEGDTGLARRLAIVQDAIGQWLDRAMPGSLRVISMCAGDGRDLLGVLGTHPRASDVHALLVERDARLAERARDAARIAGLEGIEVRSADAGQAASYAEMIPADLVLVCGVFGNISDASIDRTIESLPMLSAIGAWAIWTRHRGEPDRTPMIRARFIDAGFEEVSFQPVPDSSASVGVARYQGPLVPYRSRRMFQFEA